MNGVSITLRTFGASLFSRGGMPRGVWVFLLVTLASIGAYFYGAFDRTQIIDLGHWALFPGTPLLALALSGIPLVEPHTGKTLLYLTVAPVSRTTLAVVRTLATSILVGCTLAAIAIVANAVAEIWSVHSARQIGAIILGSIFYTTLFGMIQIAFKKGLFAGVLFYFLLDVPLARLPAELSMLAPSWHLRVLAGPTFTSDVARVGSFSAAPENSAFFLIAGTLLCGLSTIVIFKRKDIGDLC